jgi:hypothetical protein
VVEYKRAWATCEKGSGPPFRSPLTRPCTSTKRHLRLDWQGCFLVVTCTLGSGTRLVSERAAAVTACSFLPWSIGNVGGRWTLHPMMLGRVNDTPITNPRMKAINIKIIMVSIIYALLSSLRPCASALL